MAGESLHHREPASSGGLPDGLGGQLGLNLLTPSLHIVVGHLSFRPLVKGARSVPAGAHVLSQADALPFTLSAGTPKFRCH